MESWINKWTEDKVKMQMRTVKPAAAAANSWLFPEDYLGSVTQSHKFAPTRQDSSGCHVSLWH